MHPNSQHGPESYYVKAPKNSGSLFVEDPRPGPNIIIPRRLEGLPKALMACGALSSNRRTDDYVSGMVIPWCRNEWV